MATAFFLPTVVPHPREQDGDALQRMLQRAVFELGTAINDRPVFAITSAADTHVLRYVSADTAWENFATIVYANLPTGNGTWATSGASVTVSCAAFTVSGAFTATGAVVASSTAAFASGVTMSATVTVSGAATFASTVGITGAVTASSTATFAGLLTAQAGLTVSGGNLSFTQAGTYSVDLTDAAGTARYMTWQTSGVNRWLAGADAAAESGANAGSDWQLIARADNGSDLGAAITVTRSSRLVTLSQGLAIAGGSISAPGIATTVGALTATTGGFSGAITASSTATFTSAVTASSTATFASGVVASATFTVSGATLLGDTARITGAITASSTAAFASAVTMSATLTVSSNVTASGNYSSGSPSGGTAAPWKFGSYVDGTISMTVGGSQYVELDVSGTLYRLAVVT